MQNGSRPRRGAGDSVGIIKADAAENTRTPTPTQATSARPVFALTIEYAGTPEHAIHGLRALLKRLLRNHRFRVRSIEEIGADEASHA